MVSEDRWLESTFGLTGETQLDKIHRLLSPPFPSFFWSAPLIFFIILQYRSKKIWKHSPYPLCQRWSLYAVFCFICSSSSPPWDKILSLIDISHICIETQVWGLHSTINSFSLWHCLSIRSWTQVPGFPF